MNVKFYFGEINQPLSRLNIFCNALIKLKECCNSFSEALYNIFLVTMCKSRHPRKLAMYM